MIFDVNVKKDGLFSKKYQMIVYTITKNKQKIKAQSPWYPTEGRAHSWGYGWRAAEAFHNK